MAAPHPQTGRLHLRLQASGDKHSLAALLLTPRGVVPLPPIPMDPPDGPGLLQALLEHWQRTLRFAYVIERPGAESAAVQATAQALIAALDRFWRHPSWAPLHQALEQEPNLPLWLEIPPPPGTTPQPRHPLALAEKLPWEHLPLNQRPLWRVRSLTSSLPLRPARPRWRRPRLLLITGPSKGLRLEEQIERLSALDRTGRITLHTLRGEQSSIDSALNSLRDPQGWDGLIYLGHGEPSLEGGGGLRLGRGVLEGPALADALRQAAPQLVLLSRCHGTDLVSLCLEAGVPWVLAFRGEVPDTIALAAFAPFWQALVEGDSLLEASTRAHDALERRHPGSSPLLSLVGRVDAEPLRLPLRRRHLWRQRLASSQKRQLVATGLALGLGLVVYGVDGLGWRTVRPWGLPNANNALLDHRLNIQSGWRLFRGVAPTPARVKEHSPLVVWLLNRKLAYRPGEQRVSRQVISQVLQALPPQQTPVVGIDVRFDDMHAEASVQPRDTATLAGLIRAQGRKKVFQIFVAEATPDQAKGDASRSAAFLKQHGLQEADARMGFLRRDVPLQLIWMEGPIFAAMLAGMPGEVPKELPSSGEIIDWSIDWFSNDDPLIKVVPINTLHDANAFPRGSRVLVGVGPPRSGSSEQTADLFDVPVALALQPSWRTIHEKFDAPTDKMSGALVRAVLAESLRRGHWLTPLAPLPTMALAAGLGVLLAVALERRRYRLLALALISLLAVPVSLELALSLRVLVPLLFPLGTLWASCLSRRERDG
jgi:hypothetical protein